MKKIWVGVVILIIAALAILLVVTQTKREPEEIKIGILYSQTGSLAPYGEKALRGIRIAIDEINQKGGIDGKKIRIIVEDAKSNPKDSVSAFQKLVTVDKVPVIIGPIASSLALACAPLANQKKVVLFSTGASALDYTSPNDFTFRNWPTAKLLAQRIADIAYSIMGLRKIAILYINNDMGISYKLAFINRFEELGGKIVAIQSFEQDDRDMRTQLAKIKIFTPEAIYLLGHAFEIAQALKQIREIGIKAQILSNIGIEDPKVIEIAGEAANGVIYTTSSYNPKEHNPRIRNYEEEYLRRYGEHSDAFAATAYDAVYIIKEAIEKGGYSSKGIKEALFKIKNFPGITGITSFDENGDVIKEVAIKKIKGREFIFLDQELNEII